MIQKNKIHHFLVFFLLASALFSQNNRVKVIVDEAIIFAEASEHSARIDTVKKDTILTLFKPRQPGETWHYVNYRSENWNAKLSGFIHASQVEPLIPTAKEEPVAVTEKSKPTPVTKVLQITEMTGATPLPSSRIFPLPSQTEPELQSGTFKTAITASPDAPILPDKQKQIFPIDRPKITTAPITTPKLETRIETIIKDVPSPPGRVLIFSIIPMMESHPPIFSQSPSITTAPAPKSPTPNQIPPIAKPKIARAEIPPQQQEIQVEKGIGEISIPPGRKLTFLPAKAPESQSQVFLPAPKTEPTPPSPPPVSVAKKKPAPPPPTKKVETPKTKDPAAQIQQPPQLLKLEAQEKIFSLFTISLGYGSTTGGIGGAVQMNTRSGFSFHAGVGYYPAKMIFSDHDWITNKVFFSGGIKYYLPLKIRPLRPYLDLQYGGITVEAAQVVLGIWNQEYLIENHQKTLWGPSLLAGAELKFGSLGLNAAVGAAYNTTSWDFSEENLILTGDISLLLYF